MGSQIFCFRTIADGGITLLQQAALIRCTFLVHSDDVLTVDETLQTFMAGLWISGLNVSQTVQLKILEQLDGLGTLSCDKEPR